MVARGDLGVELPPEEVPLVQKRIVRAARALGKPVVVATQMLESMITAPSPTRAEVSDVGTAVFDGADAVMLSAETAAGQYPYEAVNMMDRIVARVEQDPDWRRLTDTSRPAPERTSAGAIATAARQVAETIEAEVIATFSSTGSTTLRVARERPNCPILGLTASGVTARRMAVVWGVHPLEVSEIHSMTEMVARAVKAAQHEGFAHNRGRSGGHRRHALRHAGDDQRPARGRGALTAPGAAPRVARRGTTPAPRGFGTTGPAHPATTSAPANPGQGALNLRDPPDRG